MTYQWNTEIAQLLNRLGSTQKQLLGLLERKHDLLKQRDHKGLAELASEEQTLCSELQACHNDRQQILNKAAAAGLPADSIQSLASSLPEENDTDLEDSMRETVERSNLLQHQSFTQWVVVQRSLLHLSQLLEIIASGGQMQPTYRKGGVSENSGALMDQAV